MLVRLNLFILFFLSVLSGFGQNISYQENLKRANDIYFSNPDSSFSLSKKALTDATLANDSSNIILAHNYIARYTLLKSNFKETELHLNTSESLAKKQKNITQLAFILKLKSILQERIGNNILALQFLEQSANLSLEAKDYNGYNGALLNLSNSYIDLYDLNKADSVLKILEKDPNSNSDYYYNQNKGSFYEATKRYDLAETFYLAALDIAEKEKMIDSKATILMKLGRNARLNNNLNKSVNYLAEGEKYCIDNKQPHELLEVYREFRFSYDSLNDIKNELEYTQKYFNLKDTLINIDKVNQIAILEQKLAVAEKQNELDFEKEKSEREKSKNTLLLMGLVGSAAVIFLILFLFIKTRKLKQGIVEKNTLLEVKQHEIIDSINYAKRIQYSLLANIDFINKHLGAPNNFIYFKPKDIVSGDFYWACEHKNKFYFAVCDCTGHGVPGAFMSLLSIGFLSEAIKEKDILEPNKIFDYVRERLISAIGNDGQKDGMDGVLICLDKSQNTLSYAAANNEPILIRNNTFIDLQKDKMPIGYGEKKDKFTLFNIDYQINDKLYLYTDGYADQFGGEKGKKFKYKQLNDLILKNNALEFNKQKDILNSTFDAWKGPLEQVDDVCIIGIKL